MPSIIVAPVKLPNSLTLLYVSIVCFSVICLATGDLDYSWETKLGLTLPWTAEHVDIGQFYEITSKNVPEIWSISSIIIILLLGNLNLLNLQRTLQFNYTWESLHCLRCYYRGYYYIDIGYYCINSKSVNHVIVNHLFNAT